eukprot:18910-Heterococcus_DN1.PRE.2
MGKAAKQRKRQREVEAAKQVVEQAPIAAAFAQDPLAGLISPEDLATATRVMETFARHPDLYRAKPCKPLRAALHAITAAAPPGKSPVGVVSDALRDGRWNDAKAELASMRATGAVPKLGALQVYHNTRSKSMRHGYHHVPFRVRTYSVSFGLIAARCIVRPDSCAMYRCCLCDWKKPRHQHLMCIDCAVCAQRWVRDCDAAGATDARALEVLDAILRTADPAQVGVADSDPTADSSDSANRSNSRISSSSSNSSKQQSNTDTIVRWCKPWHPPASTDTTATPTNSSSGTDTTSSSSAAVVSSATAAAAAAAQQRADSEWSAYFRVVGTEAALDRRPPNKSVEQSDVSARGGACAACLQLACSSIYGTICVVVHAYTIAVAASHPLTLWASQPGSVILDEHTANGRPNDVETDGSNRVTRLEVPFAPGAFLLQNVLSKAECAQLIAASEALGYTADEPAGGSVSVLAHNFVWLADDELLSTVYSRCKPHLPAVDSTAVTAAATAAVTPSHSASSDSTAAAAVDTATTAATGSRKRQRVVTATDVNDSSTASDAPKRSGQLAGQLAGLNSRWRLYRYKPGSIYRPHIDGAWPASGVNADTGEYMYDAYGDRWSRLTFLIYLNDGFEGGHTAFYTPSRTEGRLNASAMRTIRDKARSICFKLTCAVFCVCLILLCALHLYDDIDCRGVVPRAGSVLVFPHGEAKALLHEGSPVTQGVKYIARTEVEYII